MVKSQFTNGHIWSISVKYDFWRGNKGVWIICYLKYTYFMPLWMVQTLYYPHHFYLSNNSWCWPRKIYFEIQTSSSIEVNKLLSYWTKKAEKCNRLYFVILLRWRESHQVLLNMLTCWKANRTLMEKKERPCQSF